MDSFIKSIRAVKIKDSRNKDTVKVIAANSDGKEFFGAFPCGESVGRSETKTVKVDIALENINRTIANRLVDEKLDDFFRLDNILLGLDRSTDKSQLGANAILPTSIAMIKAVADANNSPLWKYISYISELNSRLPLPMMVMVEGGKHASFPGISWQEFLLNGSTAQGVVFLERLKNYLTTEGIDFSEGVEGGVSFDIKDNWQALEIFLSIFHQQNGLVNYSLDLATSHHKISEDTIDRLLIDKGLFSIEDPFDQEDWQNWVKAKKNLKGSSLLIGDDLIATNPKRLLKAISLGACDGVTIKPNQVGSVSETITAAMLARKNKLECIVSHRAGETMDDFIADLAVGIGASHLKAGAPTQTQRWTKYHRLEKIKSEMEGNGAGG